MEQLARAKHLFTTLSQAEKLMFVGAAISVVSLFLPWYRDLDAWGKGDVFLGVTGPLSTIGFVVFILSGAVLLNLAGKAMGKEIRTLKKINHLALKVAAQNLLMIVITASIYFDPKFGVNITLKETAIGIFLCLVGSVMTGIGGYMKRSEPQRREVNVFEEVEAHIERIHKKLDSQTPDDVPLAEKQYKAMHEKDEDEKTIQMEL